jgi:toxin ParE1/3/4
MVKLEWSPKTLKELEEIFEYIAEDSREYALIFVSKLIAATKSKVDFPMLGRIVPEFKNIKIREKIFKNYRIIYRFENDIIEIITIFHNARNLTEEDV